jgi:hypothetical protein
MVARTLVQHYWGLAGSSVCVSKRFHNYQLLTVDCEVSQWWKLVECGSLCYRAKGE